MGPAQPASGGAGDAFVVKLNSAGKLVYSTFLGGAGEENQNVVGGLLSMPVGNVFLTGDTTSNNFPVTANHFRGLLAGLSMIVS